MSSWNVYLRSNALSQNACCDPRVNFYYYWRSIVANLSLMLQLFRPILNDRPMLPRICQLSSVFFHHSNPPHNNFRTSSHCSRSHSHLPRRRHRYYCCCSDSETHRDRCPSFSEGFPACHILRAAPFTKETINKSQTDARNYLTISRDEAAPSRASKSLFQIDLKVCSLNERNK